MKDNTKLVRLIREKGNKIQCGESLECAEILGSWYNKFTGTSVGREKISYTHGKALL